MVKKRLAIVGVLVICLLAAVFATGCSQGVELTGLSNLSLISSGVLQWDEVQGATYEVSIDDENYTEVDGARADLLEIVTSVEVTKVYVRAKVNGNVVGKSEFAISVQKLPTPEKPTVAYNEETKSDELVWNEVTGAKQYLVRVNNGDRWIVRSVRAYAPTVTGSYTIEVKCRGYADAGVLYIESDASPVSDTLDFIIGPTLSNDDINVISWESATEFDSYNIWIDGRLTRYDVTSPINLVTGGEPILTITGEYDIQIEAVLGAKSVFSNLLEDVGTSNINKNEMFSFDNRKFNLTAAKPGAYLTDEQKHGDSGYSLFVSAPDQYNIVRYAHSGINEVDFTSINQISYWVYVPTIEGYEGTTVPGYTLPRVVYDGTAQPPAEPKHRRVNYQATGDIPIGEWTKVTIDCEIQNERVLILSSGNFLSVSDGDSGTTYVHVPVYIDDISYESVDTVTDYEYKLVYGMNNGGEWYSPGQKISFGTENAGKTVDVSMQISGTANASSEDRLGLTVFTKDGNGDYIHLDGNTPTSTKTYKYQFGSLEEIDRAKLSTTEYSTYSTRWELDSNGDYVTSAFLRSPSGSSVRTEESYVIYIKGVTVNNAYEAPADAEYTMNYAGGSWDTPYANATTLDFGAEYANKSVLAQFDICGTASAAWVNSDQLGIHTYNSSNAYDGTTATTFPTEAISTTTAWTTETAYFTLDETGKVKVGLRYWLGNTSPYTAYLKNLKVLGAANPTGSRNAEPRYAGYVGLATSLAVGTPVTVTMDVRITGAVDAYSLVWAIGADGGAQGCPGASDAAADHHLNLHHKEDLSSQLKDGTTWKTGWVSVTFTTIVTSWGGNIAATPYYGVVDASGYGNSVMICMLNATSLAPMAGFRNVTITATTTTT